MVDGCRDGVGLLEGELVGDGCVVTDAWVVSGALDCPLSTLADAA